jgi:hypothetical protein
VPEKRAECLLSCLKPSLRVVHVLSKTHLSGPLEFLQCLRTCRQQTGCEQAALILYAA